MSNKERTQQSNKRPWPTKAAMQQVYEKHLWGGEAELFYSGEGSHAKHLVEPYISVVSKFLSSFSPLLTVCDLGCGDFNIGQQLVSFAKQYHAVDIVPELIVRNQQTFEAPNLSFEQCDIAKDELPQGDCAILRQVLQHLSNAEVFSIVQKLYAYRFVLVTEHLPEGEFIPNIDILSGQGIRLKKQSGIDLMEAPFNFQAKGVTELVRVKLEDGRGVIVTKLYENKL